MDRWCLSGFLLLLSTYGWAGIGYEQGYFMVLNDNAYRQVVKRSREEIQTVVEQLQGRNNLEQKIALIVQAFKDIPYSYNGGIGEGDWQPGSAIYQAGALHINQQPVYRTDQFSCQSFVQMVMALLYSNNLNDFDRRYLQIAYGAANLDTLDRVHLYNRNHFIEGDFNPVNQRSGLLKEIPQQIFVDAIKMHSLILTKPAFFQHLAATNYVKVLSAKDGPRMLRRLLNDYPKLPFSASETIKLSYIPKQALVKKIGENYMPNNTLLDKIPTPSVVELVYDPHKWRISGRYIKEILGTELAIAHMGILYRQQFKYGDMLYRQIRCDMNDSYQKSCKVRPIYCVKKTCDELMFAHATTSHPNHYVWFKDTNHHYHCSASPPLLGTKSTPCNRVESLPFFAYLTDYQYGSHWYMRMPAFIGVHIEELRR